MSRAARLAPGMLLLAACGGDAGLPAEDLLLSVAVGAERVVPGQAFPVTVVRQWSRDLEPAPWEERALAPLVLRLEARERHEDGRRVRETLRYRGYAFSRTDLRIPAAVLEATPRGGGPVRRTSSARVRLPVVPEVPTAAPGAPELPGGPLAEPVAAWPWWAGAGLLCGALLGLLRRRVARRAPPPAPAASPPAPDAAARLAAVGARPSTRAQDLAADVREIADVLREHVTWRHGVRTAERTSEEVLAALPAGPRAALANLLVACDPVRYGAHAPTLVERTALLAAAQAFVAGGGA